jgi:hypothetical protein
MTSPMGRDKGVYLMGRKLYLKRQSAAASQDWNPEQVLAEALAEKADFLLKHPQHLEFQDEIEGILEKAGSSENRMTVLAMLMEGKLIELHGELKKLNKILLAAAA